jgi:hypothetical protein
VSKQFNGKVFEIVGALDREKVAVKEITRRLNEDECGLGYEVSISERSVYDYRVKYRKDHGPPPTGDVEDKTAQSIEALKRRTLERIAIEIQHYETIRPGEMTGDQVGVLRRLFSTMDDMERREQVAEKRRGRSASRPKGNGNGQDPPESAIEAIARREAAQSHPG